MRPNEFKEQHKLKNKYAVSGSELASSMAAVMGALLRKHGIQDQKADEVALEAIEEMRREYGGTQLYFSREETLQKAAIHEEVFDLFDRNEMTVPDLALKYGFSTAWVYAIIRNIRRRRKEERDAQASAALKGNQERWKRES
ncbi:MAG TPA: Mor transcription activator family protein [Pseudomonas sp.]|nr:Mor transcription activator family protein [Pseudomonas sp.]